MPEMMSYPLSAEGGVVADGALWFAAVNYNALCKMDLETQVVSFVTRLSPKYGWDSDHLYSLAAYYEGRLIFFPVFADEVLDYDIKTGRSCRFPVTVPELNGEMIPKFRSAACVGNNLWIMPQGCHRILSYDLKHKKLVEYADWFGRLDVAPVSSGSIFGGGIAVGGLLWLPCLQTNGIVEFDTEHAIEKLHRMGDSDGRFSTIVYANKRFWLIDNIHRQIVEWLPNVGVIADHRDFPSEYHSESDEYKLYDINRMYPFGDDIIGIPSHASHFIKISVHDGAISLIGERSEGSNYISACEDYATHRCFCFSQTNHLIKVIKDDCGKWGCQEIPLTLKADPNLIENLFAYNTEDLWFFADKNHSLSGFLNFLDGGSGMEKAKDEKDGYVSCGENIYQEVIGRLGGR